jgi:hypothetical protein
VADQTYVQPSDLRTAADKLKNLITDDHVAAFQKLVDAPMLTGNIDAGIWLQDRCFDRRAGMLQHLKDLRDAFTKLSDKMYNVADQAEKTDQSNAADMDGIAVDALNDWVNTLKNEPRPKPTYEQDNYDHGDNAKSTDQGFTYTDNGNGGYTVHTDGSFTGTDFENAYLKDLFKDNPDYYLEGGFQLTGDVTVNNDDPIDWPSGDDSG